VEREVLRDARDLETLRPGGIHRVWIVFLLLRDLGFAMRTEDRRELRRNRILVRRTLLPRDWTDSVLASVSCGSGQKSTAISAPRK
jgi:hypothetical protein